MFLILLYFNSYSLYIYICIHLIQETKMIQAWSLLIEGFVVLLLDDKIDEISSFLYHPGFKGKYWKWQDDYVIYFV
jgi:hypothetical protein